MRICLIGLIVGLCYGAEPQYSTFKRIGPGNVQKLAKAWEFDTNDAFA